MAVSQNDLTNYLKKQGKKTTDKTDYTVLPTPVKPIVLPTYKATQPTVKNNLIGRNRATALDFNRITTPKVTSPIVSPIKALSVPTQTTNAVKPYANDPVAKVLMAKDPTSLATWKSANGTAFNSLDKNLQSYINDTIASNQSKIAAKSNAASTLMAGGASLINSATFTNNKFTPQKVEHEARYTTQPVADQLAAATIKAHPVASTIGNLAGTLVGGGVTDVAAHAGLAGLKLGAKAVTKTAGKEAVAKVLPSVGKQIAQKAGKEAAFGATSNALYGAALDATQGKDGKTIAKDALLNAGIGGVLGGALGGIAGKAASKKTVTLPTVKENITLPNKTLPIGLNKVETQADVLPTALNRGQGEVLAKDATSNAKTIGLPYVGQNKNVVPNKKTFDAIAGMKDYTGENATIRDIISATKQTKDSVLQQVAILSKSGLATINKKGEVALTKQGKEIFNNDDFDSIVKTMIKTNQKADAQIANTIDITPLPTSTQTTALNIKNDNTLTSNIVKPNGNMELPKVSNMPKSEYNQLIKNYGAIKPGENPVREIQVPKRTEAGTKTRQFVRTGLESKAIPDNMIKPIKESVTKGKFAYEPLSDKKAISYADNVIQSKGFDGATKDWEAIVGGNGKVTKNDIAIGEKLLTAAAKSGNFERTEQLLSEIAIEGTRAGQVVQAMRMLKKMTPTGQLYHIENVANKFSKDMQKRLKGKQIQISDTLKKELLNSNTPEEMEKVIDKIYQSISDQVPATWVDKWNAWRYLSMLGNPRTHIRNIVGNSIFYPVRQIKNIIATGITKGATATKLLPAMEEKTASIIVPKEYKTFAKADYVNVKDSVTGTGKYNPADIIRDKQAIFNNPILEKARKFNMDLLEKEDNLFLKNAYSEALGRYMKANKYTPEFLASEQGAKVLEVARNSAIQEALKATYRDASAFANWLNRGSRNNAALNLTIGSFMPFTKTPANILKRGIEYSPIGLTKGIADATKGVQAGTKTAAEAIDEMAAGLTGTGIVALGAYLAYSGLVTGAASDDTKERNFETLQGSQNYALQLGNTSYTIDWMAPISMPLFVGVELQNTIKEDGVSFATLLNSLAKITEPAFNLSMLQGINNAIKTATYAQNAPLTSIIGTGATGYLGQAVPTLFGQVARTVDSTRRASYVDKNSPIPSGISSFGQKIAAKTPFLSKTLQPKLDAWGRTDTEPNIAKRAFENFVSPGYINSNKTTSTEKELAKLYSNTGDKTVLPSVANKYIQYDGKKYNLSAKDYTKYATLKGQNSLNIVSDLIKTDAYKQLENTDKTSAISDAYAYADALAKKKVLPNYELDGWISEAYKAAQEGLSSDKYIIAYNTVKDIKGDKNENGNSIPLSASRKKKAAIDEMTNLTKEQKKMLYDMFDISNKLY